MDTDKLLELVNRNDREESMYEHEAYWNRGYVSDDNHPPRESAEVSLLTPKQAATKMFKALALTSHQEETLSKEIEGKQRQFTTFKH